MSKREKLKAALMGYAIGNALGKGTEFMTRRMVRIRYPFGLRDYDSIFQDVHRSQWLPGEWTNDTETLLRMGYCIVNDGGHLKIDNQAVVLKKWYEEKPKDLVANMRWVLSQDDYVESPLYVAHRVWTEMKHLEPSNESLGRSMLASLSPGDAVKNAREITLLTHHDVRCEACAAIVGHVASALFNDEPMPSREELRATAGKVGNDMAHYVRPVFTDNLETLEIDDEEKYWCVRKTLGAVLWTLGNCASAEEALYEMVDAGGDADTNAALALALFGLRDGKLNLPADLTENLVGKNKIEALADELSNVWFLS